ncbi:MAG: DUF819 family protein [Cellvibrionaceae bacterium]
MMDTTAVISILFFLTAPALFIAFASRHRWAKKIGVIGLCYLTGLVLGNSLLSPGFLGWLGASPQSLQQAQQGLGDFSIAFALPMLLMTLNIRQWHHQAGKALLSMLLATTAVVSVATALFILWESGAKSSIDSSHLAAMAVGVYTGGTPNLAAIKAGLDIPHADYLVFHSLDTVIGAGYLLFMLSVAIPLIRRLFPSHPQHRHLQYENESNGADKNADNSNLTQYGDASQLTQHGDASHLTQYGDDYSPLIKLKSVRQLLAVSGLSLTCLAIALGLSQWIVSAWQWQGATALTIVLLTVCGAALSTLNSIQRLQLAYRLGMYWIYVFCLVIASMATVDDIFQVDPSIALFIVFVLAFSLLLHGLLCRLNNIDGDTFMITSVAAICSPPFVPVMARALNNSSLILSGMTTGIIGYALGNFLGISLALALQSLS